MSWSYANTRTHLTTKTLQRQWKIKYKCQTLNSIWIMIQNRYSTISSIHLLYTIRPVSIEYTALLTNHDVEILLWFTAQSTACLCPLSQMQRALEQADFVTRADIKYINASGTIVSISLSVAGGPAEAWPSRRPPLRAHPTVLRSPYGFKNYGINAFRNLQRIITH